MKVLIAEDRSTTRFILKKKLSEWGYQVTEAEDGIHAWEALIMPDPPRIAILDWMMPGLDGVSICRKLKERMEGPFIYTILLTSKSQREDLVYALENGAHNFQSKPISPDELRSHINVGKHLVEADDKLIEYATQMERLAEERARQLVHADRLASLGMLTAGIAHEIGNPLTFIMGQAQMIQHQWRELAPFIKECVLETEKKNVRFESAFDGLSAKFSAIIEGTERINTIIKSMKSFSRKDTGSRTPVQIEACIENALRLCHNAIKYHLTIEKRFAPDLPEVLVNPQQIEQVLVNLFTNASDAVKAIGNGTIIISTSKTDHDLLITVEDTGQGLPPDATECIFKPFFTTKEVGRGTGLGLFISRGIIEGHSGTISFENRKEGGARFFIRLPFKK